MRNALEIRDNLSLCSEKIRPRRRMVPLKYSGDFRSLIVDVISVRRSSPLSATTRRLAGLEDLINACQIVPANPFEYCNPNAASAPDSRPAAAEHQFVCRGNKRRHQSPCALPDVCARLQCILNILPVVQRLSADVALVYLCLAKRLLRNMREALFSFSLEYVLERSNELLNHVKIQLQGYFSLNHHGH